MPSRLFNLLYGAATLIWLVSADDPWLQVQTVLNSVQEVDYLDGDNTILDNREIFIPCNYSLEMEEALYMDKWEKMSQAHRSLYDDLIDSSDNYNNTEATYTLAQIHLWGDYGFPHNKALAFQYLEKFNELTDYKNSTALFELGVMHITGMMGVKPVEIAKGLMFFEKAALLGDVRAIQALAYRNQVGLNVPTNIHKALIFYRALSDRIKETYTTEEWALYFPVLESYNMRIPDFEDGLLGAGLNVVSNSVSRTPSKRPDMSSVYFTQMNEGKIVLSFSPEKVFSSGGAGDDVFDELVEVYYTAYDLYMGTYNNRRDPSRARIMLENIYADKDNIVELMDNLQLYFYGRCLELLGHIYLRGEGIPSKDVTVASLYLRRSAEIVGRLSSMHSPAHADLGLIEQFGYQDIPKAISHYKKMLNSNSNTGVANYHLAKLALEFPKKKLGDPLLLMQGGCVNGYVPAAYDLALMLEEGIDDRYSTEDTVYMFKTFVEDNDHLVAPQLKKAYTKLLLGDVESALWGYLLAAEQGFESSQVSAAHILYRKHHFFEKPNDTLELRKQLAVSYYARSFRLSNVDAGVIAGNIYFEMKDYTRALTMYQSASLKYSSVAMWNMGYMYEHGCGLEKDFYLAKRFYDEAYEFNHKIFFGVKLSLARLVLKSWLLWLTGKEQHNKSDPGSIYQSLPWYKQIAKILGIAVKNNTQMASMYDKRRNTTMLDNFLYSLGLNRDDLFGIGVILALMVATFIGNRVANARRQRFAERNANRPPAVVPEAN